MHFRHSDQQNSSGGRTQTPAWASQLRCSQGRAPHDMVCPPKLKILATPPATVAIHADDENDNDVDDVADDDADWPACSSR